MNPPPKLDSILDELDSVARRSTWSEACSLAGAVLAAGVALGLLVAELTTLIFALAVVGVTLVAAVITGWIVVKRQLGSPSSALMRAARLAQKLAPELGSAAASAVDLRARLESDDASTFSANLAEDHVQCTVSRLQRAKLAERFVRSRQPRRRRSVAAVVVAFALAALAIVVFEDGRSRWLAFLEDPTAARVSEVPLTGDITITYRFPAYTGLEDRVVPGGDGSISALVGTEVILEAIADRDVSQAALQLVNDDDTASRTIPLSVEDDRLLRGRFPVLQSGRYFFEFSPTVGERLEDRVRHPIVATLDEYPVVGLDEPSEDVELKDDRDIAIVWGASDDYGVGEVWLVIDAPGASEPRRIALDADGAPDKRREGRYRWSVAELALQPGEEVRFYVEVLDNDTIGGPKVATSEVRKLVIFSARQRHQELLDQQRDVMDAMVDLLALDLETPVVPSQALDDQVVEAHGRIADGFGALAQSVGELVRALVDDSLSEPEIADTFSNVGEHLTGAANDRRQALDNVAAAGDSRIRRQSLARIQRQAVSQLEKDLIYLDDLIAVQKIDELKSTAEELLSAQRQLQDKLERYRETRDPGMRAELEREIQELREKMMEMLARMSDIKRQLPGEYRNMESGRMLELDHQLDRLETMLREGRLDEAAAELEDLANMIENMVDNVSEGQKNFGEERYAEMRQELQRFASDFEQLQAEQEAVTERAEELARDYRKRSIERVGKDLDDVIRRARRLAKGALEEIDRAAQRAPFVFGQLGDQLESGRQRLADLDQLLEQKDIAEAREFGRFAEDHLMWAETYLRHRAEATQDKRAQLSWDSGRKARGKASEINALLDRLFPSPREVMSEAENQRMDRMAQKQKQLSQRASELAERMAKMSEEIPVFGQEPREGIARARDEMDKASEQMRAGNIPRAAASKRRALDELKALQQSMKQSEKRAEAGPGMPMPMAGRATRREAGGSGVSGNDDPVELPGADKNRASPSFRQELLEAAKQKAPDRYEDATRRYYEELIR